MRPHRWKPNGLRRPWDSPGKNIGVGCPFLLQCMKVKSESEVAQWCSTLSDPMDCSLPGSSAHGIFQARVLEWGAIAFSTILPTICHLNKRFLLTKRKFVTRLPYTWHHQLEGREFEWTLGVGGGQGGLACCDSWGRKELDTTQQLNWTVYLRKDSLPSLWWPW